MEISKHKWTLEFLKKLEPNRMVTIVGYVLLGARSDGYKVRRDRFVVP
jgi:hypothetical protein